MNGANLTTLISEKVIWPNGITIDYITKELFWVDARLDVIEYAGIDGRKRKIVPHVKVSHPFAVTVFEGKLYWTDWMTKAVYKSDKWSGKYLKIIKNTTNKPMDIQVCVCVCSSRGWLTFLKRCYWLVRVKIQYARDDEGPHFCINQNKNIDNDLYCSSNELPNHLALLTMISGTSKIISEDVDNRSIYNA